MILTSEICFFGNKLCAHLVVKVKFPSIHKIAVHHNADVCGGFAAIYLTGRGVSAREDLQWVKSLSVFIGQSELNALVKLEPHTLDRLCISESIKIQWNYS